MTKYRIKEHPEGTFRIEFTGYFGEWITSFGISYSDINEAKATLIRRRKYEEEISKKPKYHY